MTIHGHIVHAGAVTLLLAAAAGLSGCEGPGAAHTSAAAAAPRRAPSVTGTWVYRDPRTVETLYLRQGKHGAVTGSGKAVDKGNNGAVGHTEIDLRSGRVHGSTLTLQVTLVPLDWGNGLTPVQDLTCATTSQVLHCRTTTPILSTAAKRQDFYRR